MKFFEDYLSGIETSERRLRTAEVLNWVSEKYPFLEPRIAWNQPMFIDHGTFIIGFSTSKKHLAVAPEKAAIEHFSTVILQTGYEHTKELIRMPWDRPVDYSLLQKLIEYNIAEKAECKTFWRRAVKS